MAYTFGDGDPAERRLALVARVFEPASRPFLEAHGRRGATLAVDLGCGPGHTTPMLRLALACRETVGLDASERYVAAARAAETGCAFHVHDVLATPYPRAPADTIYARFLVSHLEDAPAAVDRFASQLAAGGRLLLDEVEWIETDEPAFRDYLAHVAALLDSQGQELYVGPRLSRHFAGDARVVHDAVRELAVAPADAAGMFGLNWETLQTQPAIVARTDDAERRALGVALARIAADEASRPIRWGLRQLVLEAPTGSGRAGEAAPRG